MAKRSRKVYCGTISAMDQFNAHKPQFNGYAGGYGAHRNKKAYCRTQKHKTNYLFD